VGPCWLGKMRHYTDEKKRVKRDKYTDEKKRRKIRRMRTERELMDDV